MTHNANFILTFFWCIIISASCKTKSASPHKTNGHKNSWTEIQKRKYFQDSIAYRTYNGQFGQKDSLNNFTIFARNMFSDIHSKTIGSPFIYAFEEPYIDTTLIDSTKSWLRITVDPTFFKPYCLILENKNNRSYLTYKTTDGHGGYYSGLLDFSATKIVEDSILKNCLLELDDIDFWQLGNDSTCIGIDGEGWIIEAINNGHYNAISRWTPIYCENIKTQKIGQLGVRLKENTKSFEISLPNRQITDSK